MELNCGETVEQKSAKNSFSVPHYGIANSIMWNNYGIAYSTLWNNRLINQPEIPHYGTFDLRGIRFQFHTMEQNVRCQIRGLSHATVLRQALASSEPHYVC